MGVEKTSRMMDRTPVKQERALGINSVTKDRLRQAQAKKQLQLANNGTAGTAKTTSKDRKSRIGAALGHFLDDVTGSEGDNNIPTAPESQPQSPPKTSASKRRSSKTGATVSPGSVKVGSKRANYFEKFGKPLSSEKLKASFRIKKEGLSNSDHSNPVVKSKRSDPLSKSEHNGTSSTSSKVKKAASKRAVSKAESTEKGPDLGNMLSQLNGAPKKRGARSVVSMPAAPTSSPGSGRDEIRKRRGSAGPIDTEQVVRKRSGSVGPLDTGSARRRTSDAGAIRKRSGSSGPVDTGARRRSIGPNANARAQRRRDTASSSGGSSVDESFAESGSFGSKGSKGSKGSILKNIEKKAKSKRGTVGKVEKAKPSTKKLSKPDDDDDDDDELGDLPSMEGGATKKKGPQSRRVNKSSKGPALGKSMRASQKMNKSKRMSSQHADTDLGNNDDDDAPVPKSKKATKAKSKKQLTVAAPPAYEEEDEDNFDWDPGSRPSQRSLAEKSEKSSSQSGPKDFASSSNSYDDDELSLCLDDLGAPDAFEAQEETIRAMAKRAVPKRLGPPARAALPEMRLERGQSMMFQRDKTRRAGKSNSLKNLVEYTEEELPSTSYFASNHILINRERMKRGLRPLSRNSTMDDLARDHANKMAASKGCSPIQTTFVGNVVRGESIRSIHKITMQHKDGRERFNILNPYFQDFGVGTCKGEDGMLYMCQLFSERIELTCMDTQG